MNTMLVPLDNATSFSFDGEMISEALGVTKSLDHQYEESDGPWAEFRLYSTLDGRYVCEQVRCENWKGGHERHKISICDSKNKIRDFFGTGGLARELYADADLIYAEDLEND